MTAYYIRLHMAIFSVRHFLDKAKNPNLLPTRE